MVGDFRSDQGRGDGRMTIAGINSSSDHYSRHSMLNAFWKESNEALLRDLAIRKERLTAEAERRLSRYGPFSLFFQGREVVLHRFDLDQGAGVGTWT